MTDRLKFQWQPNVKILMFVLLFLPLTIALGFWQLDRAEEKRLIIQEQADRELLPALDNNELASATDLHLRRFDLLVEFDPERYFLLDNRVNRGRPGYEVLNLARLDSQNRLVMINRGWVAADLDRSQLPQIDIPLGPTEVQGYVYSPDTNYFMLGDPSWTGTWPERIVYADAETIAARLRDGESLLRYQLRLAEDDASAFLAEWRLVNQQPGRHLGYAVQWFLMAIALLVLGIFANSNLAQLLSKQRD